MARLTEAHNITETAEFSEEEIERLEAWLKQEIENSLSSRKAIDSNWRENLRRYEAIPKYEVRNWPVENAPNVEVALGAIACDALYAQVIDLIFSISPILTCMPVGKDDKDGEAVADAKALQRYVNWAADNEWKIRIPAEHGALDFIQLGTCFFYSPFIEHEKKTARSKTLSFGPRVRVHPIEDVLFPAGTGADPQEMPWIGLRFWLTEHMLRARARKNNWVIEEKVGGNSGAITPIAGKTAQLDWMKMRRLALGREQPVSGFPDIYEIVDVYAFFDIDDDGIEEDLYIVFDRTTKKILKVAYNPYDNRPGEKAEFQKRAHLAYGMGVLEMTAPFQDAASEFFNDWALNTKITNTKLFFGRAGALPENFRVWGNKYTEVDGDPNTVLSIQDMGKDNPGLAQALATTIGFAERRVGINEMNTPRPSQVLGSRTPGITALTLMQSVNRRFTPAFDSFRMALAAACRQCLFRLKERLLAGGKEGRRIEEHIVDVLGMEDGLRVVTLLKNDKFEEAVSVELTASSASVNREADRQNAAMLMTILSQYYQNVMQLAMLVSQPGVPPIVLEAAKQIIRAASELIDRTVRTFDQVRDPQTFVVDFSEQLDQMVAVDPMVMQAIAALMGGLGGQGQEEGAAGMGSPAEAGGMKGGEAPAQSGMPGFPLAGLIQGQ